MKIDRNQLIAEQKLKKQIREAIKILKIRKKAEKLKTIREERELKSLIRQLIVETDIPDPHEAPHSSTGINVLEDLLKKIVPILEIDFKKLTTSEEQRASFRAHVLQAVKNTLIPPQITDLAGTGASEAGKFISIKEQNEDITIDVEGDDESPDFIDIKPEKKTEKETEKDTFGLEGEDETGRDMAFEAFKKIEGNILNSWETLYSEEDKSLFFDYLLTNLKLYFDKFEDELHATLPEPTTDVYDAQIASEHAPGEIPI